MDKEKMERAQELYVQAKQIEERVGVIEQQFRELHDFDAALDKISESDEKEMLAPIGKGVYIKSEMKDKSFFVNVGAGIIVKKTHGELKKVVKSQMLNLGEIKTQMHAYLASTAEEIEILAEANK